MEKLRIVGLMLAIGILSGCSYFKDTVSEPVEDITPISIPEGRYLDYVPLSENWHDMKVLKYTTGQFTFPPPAGYKVLNYVDYVDNLSLDLYREFVDEKTDFLDVIKYRQGMDHCNLYGENISTIKGLDLVEVKGDCYVWHRGSFKRKYYFVRVGGIVFTFRLLCNSNNFEDNQAEFDDFVDYAIKNYLAYTAEERASDSYEHYAYPLGHEELISFFQPGAQELKNLE